MQWAVWLSLFARTAFKMMAHRLHATGRPCFGASSGQRPTVRCHAYTLKGPGPGQEVVVTKAKFVIGSAEDCDLRLPKQRNVSPKHATLTLKGATVFCTALVGEEVWDPSSTWLDGQELRPRVAYLLGSGAQVAIGEPDHKVEVTFKEASGNNPLMEMLVQGMASNASPEVRKQLGQKF